MSFRTILVGMIAAACGTFATAGFMMLDSPQQPTIMPPPEHTVLVARVNLELGQEVTAEMLSPLPWFSETLPAGATADSSTLVGKFVAEPIIAGDLVTLSRVTSTPTGLQLADGMRAFSIDAKSVSANVGRNLIPGNRVDIIWQTNSKLKEGVDPVSMRLLQNVKILAVGDTKSSDRAITFEVKPKMDEDLTYAQSFGNLSLSLRSPNDNDGVDPIQSVTFADLLVRREAEQQEREAEARRPSALDALLKTLVGRMDSLEDGIKNAQSAEPPVGRAASERIPKGMRAVTVLTPTESSGVAGLLVPGDRVDLQLTLSKGGQSSSMQSRDRRSSSMPTENLIENIEVLAVDTQLQELDDAGQRKMSRSVTLIVSDGMQADIARAEKLGTLTLVLRGREDRMDGPPRTALTLDDFVVRYMPEVGDMGNTTMSTIIRTYRGDAPSDVAYARRGL